MATRKRGRISKAFKREVAIEYIQGGVTLQALALNTIFGMLHKYQVGYIIT